MANLATNVIRVVIPDDHPAGRQVSMGDIAAKIEIVRLRKEFNAAVLDSLKDFARNNAMDSDVDFSNAHVNTFNVILDCNDRFEKAVKAAAVPHIGAFQKNDVMFYRP